MLKQAQHDGRWGPSLHPFDLLRGLDENGGDIVERLLAGSLARDPVPERGEKVADRSLDRRAAGLAPILAEAGQAGEQAFDLVRLVGEMGLALGRDAKCLAGAA